MNIKIFTKKEDFIKAGQILIEDLCSIAIRNLTIALSGGSTPTPIYEALLKSKKIPLQIIDFWQVDERYTNNMEDDSNYKMINTALFSKEEQPASFHYFDTSLPIEKALNKYEKDLEKYADNGFDLVILGIGLDGHTGSIFPHSKAVNEKDRLVAHTKTKNFAIPDRLTLTFPAIFNSKKILILLSGHEKEAILHELTSGTKTPEEFPAKKILNHQDVTIFALL